ncbi:MAG: hypothetical protein ACREPQ_14155 [Rhodanobacter sp.]
MTLAVTLLIEIGDEVAFRQAAHDRALTDNLCDDEAATYLDIEETSLGQCAVMLLDPGVSPPGCSIVDSSTETY